MHRVSSLTQTVITSPTQITKEWLEAILFRAGRLVSGGIASFELTSQTATWSTSVDITLAYQTGSIGSLPTRLFLKLCQVGQGGFGQSEVDYYAKDYLDNPDVPLLTCYEAAYSPPDLTHSPAIPGHYHLLLENVGATHANCWQRQPDVSFARQLGTAFAALHAPYWGAARLTKHCAASFPQVATEQLARYFAHIRPGLTPLLAALEGDGDGSTDPAWLTLIPKIVDWHPQLMQERIGADSGDGTGFTLIHGDPNPGNILYPTAVTNEAANETGQLYLIDRQPFEWSLTHWLGVSDLAYAIVTWWQPELRRVLEFEALDSYYAGLVARGITGYSWQQLVYDYKLCAIQTLYVATEWCTDEKTLTEMRWVWYPQLERVMAAFTDLDCVSLLVRQGTMSRHSLL